MHQATLYGLDLDLAKCLMHRHVTHNRSHPSYNDFCRSVLHFLRVEVPKNWPVFCNSVTDNFRVINPADFRVLKA